MPWNVSGSHGAGLHVARGPYGLRIVLWSEGPDVCDRSRPRRRTLLVFGDALGDLAGLDRRIGDVGHEFLAADGVTERRSHVVATHHIDLWARGKSHPAMLHK